MKPKEFLNQLDQDKLVAAIHDAERRTSGEIRVFISHKEVDNAVATATKIFEKLGMTKTRQRNAVLIFVAPRSRKFAVIGDEGVHKLCGDEFWQQMTEAMTHHFKAADFTQGIVEGIRKAGEVLKVHFPHRPGDRNELPDEIESD